MSRRSPSGDDGGPGRKDAMSLNVIMLGPPGAGKGTQASRLAREHNVLKISTGDILREAVTQRTHLGKIAGKTMAEGHLVPDDVMVGVVRERLMQPDTSRGFVLDGFPRTVPQATSLDEMMRGRGGLTVLHMVVPFDVLVRRLHIRRICSVCGTNADPSMPEGSRCPKCGGEFVQRTDDSEQVVRERLKVFDEETWPLVEYYRGSPAFFTIDGNQPPDRVSEQIREAVALSLGGAAVRRMDVTS
jgi:adenylate kinase